jgi:flagellar basal body-associated protein FliL
MQPTQTPQTNNTGKKWIIWVVVIVIIVLVLIALLFMRGGQEATDTQTQPEQATNPLTQEEASLIDSEILSEDDDVDLGDLV